MVKRAFDIVGSTVALLVAAPIMAAVALLVCGTMGRPVLFRKLRPGLHGRPFCIYKFRTMRLAHDPAGKPLADAERLTRVGRFLRSTSLDELPELWNVLRGDMSLVGPRPLLMEYLPLYSPEQARRHDVRPGLTGWAQVNGRNAVRWEDRFAMDTWYVDNRSLLLDLRILLLTARTVVLREGISQQGHDTMTPFTREAP
jgi:lipopolysaccharide/colanic/teichoic acid biosynthesis glycosyltransferase